MEDTAGLDDVRTLLRRVLQIAFDSIQASETCLESAERAVDDLVRGHVSQVVAVICRSLGIWDRGHQPLSQRIVIISCKDIKQKISQKSTSQVGVK